MLSSCNNHSSTGQQTTPSTENKPKSSSQETTSSTENKPKSSSREKTLNTPALSGTSSDRQEESKTVNLIADEFNSVVSIRHGVVILGTGVAIRRDGDTLYVLTAEHVLQYPSGDPLEVYLQNNQLIGSISEENYQSQVLLSSVLEKEKSNNKSIPRTNDLALLKISIVDKGLNIHISNIGEIKNGEKTHLVGYITCDNRPKLQLSKGSITSFESSGITNPSSMMKENKYKYDLTYTNNTVSGMSGSPIYNDRHQVVGIHAGISFRSTLQRGKYDTKKCDALPVNPPKDSKDSKDYTENMGTSSTKITEFLKNNLP
jgi:Trypsin-like peptidase domain